MLSRCPLLRRLDVSRTVERSAERDDRQEQEEDEKDEKESARFRALTTMLKAETGWVARSSLLLLSSAGPESQGPALEPSAGTGTVTATAVVVVARHLKRMALPTDLVPSGVWARLQLPALERVVLSIAADAHHALLACASSAALRDGGPDHDEDARLHRLSFCPGATCSARAKHEPALRGVQRLIV